MTDIGGLTAATVLALLMLPVYYRMMSRKPKAAESSGPAITAGTAETAESANDMESAETVVTASEKGIPEFKQNPPEGGDSE